MKSLKMNVYSIGDKPNNERNIFSGMKDTLIEKYCNTPLYLLVLGQVLAVSVPAINLAKNFDHFDIQSLELGKYSITVSETPVQKAVSDVTRAEMAMNDINVKKDVRSNIKASTYVLRGLAPAPEDAELTTGLYINDNKVENINEIPSKYLDPSSIKEIPSNSKGYTLLYISTERDFEKDTQAHSRNHNDESKSNNSMKFLVVRSLEVQEMLKARQIENSGQHQSVAHITVYETTGDSIIYDKNDQPVKFSLPAEHAKYDNFSEEFATHGLVNDQNGRTSFKSTLSKLREADDVSVVKVKNSSSQKMK